MQGAKSKGGINMETNRIVESFKEMVAINSTSKQEGEYHAYLKRIFSELGCEVAEDNSSKTTGLGGNNLVFTLVGDDRYEPIFFSCHTDTVPPGENIKAVIKDNVLYSDGETILAADDKAGIAAIIEAILQIKEQDLPHGTIEVVLSPGEEIGLVGSKAFDTAGLKAHYGFVLDSAGKVGIITVASPTLMKLKITLHGKAAHAGVEPEKGISAITMAATAISQIPSGRLDEKTTLNFGIIKSGTATNIVAEEAYIEMEIRSISHDVCMAKEAEVQAVFKAVAEQFGGTVSIDSEMLSKGYEFDKTDEGVKKAIAALQHMGREATLEISGGGSDANSFNEKGKEALTLSIGYEKIHTVDEYIPIEELEATADLVLALIHNQVKV